MGRWSNRWRLYVECASLLKITLDNESIPSVAKITSRLTINHKLWNATNNFNYHSRARSRSLPRVDKRELHLGWHNMDLRLRRGKERRWRIEVGISTKICHSRGYRCIYNKTMSRYYEDLNKTIEGNKLSRSIHWRKKNTKMIRLFYERILQAFYFSRTSNSGKLLISRSSIAIIGFYFDLKATFFFPF